MIKNYFKYCLLGLVTLSNHFGCHQQQRSGPLQALNTKESIMKVIFHPSEAKVYSQKMDDYNSFRKVS